MKKATAVFITIALIIALTANSGGGSTNLTSFSTKMIDTLKALFGVNQEQINSIFGILKAWNMYGDGDNNKLAYIMATAWHESKLRPVRECFASSDASARNCVRDRWYGKEDTTTGHVYYGRGFVQLTLKSNYQKMGNWLGVDLVNNPDLALDPEIGAKVIVYGMMNGSFTGKSLSDYINSSKVDFWNARRVVNSTDQATLIANYASDIQKNIS